jgi:hypothetical protein
MVAVRDSLLVQITACDRATCRFPRSIGRRLPLLGSATRALGGVGRLRRRKGSAFNSPTNRRAS